MQPDAASTSSLGESVQVGLQECVQLLRGPTDERRFVGLLLATKLLPAGNEHVMLSIHEAVGSTFLSRLLWPLKIHEACNVNDGQKAAAVGLGLAVLAGLCRVPKLSAEFIDKTPLLLKVIREGGINPVLNNDSVQPQSDSAHSADDHAVGDALECLLHIVQSSSQGHTVALQSGGLFAVAQALQNGVASGHAWTASAVQLMGLLLSKAQRCSRCCGRSSACISTPAQSFPAANCC